MKHDQKTLKNQIFNSVVFCINAIFEIKNYCYMYHKCL